MTKKKTFIIGIGNLILKDEGVGVHVIRRLQSKDLPPEVELIDGGTSTMELLGIIQEADRIIVVDAVRAGGEPGTIYRVSPEDLISETERPLSLHQVGLLEVLGMAKQLGACGNVVIIGIEPKEVSWGTELTGELETRVPRLMEAVLDELAMGA